MTPTPRKLDLKRDERLRVEWSDGKESTFPVGYLRQMCPCAACKMLREGRDPHQLLRPMTPQEAEAAAAAADPGPEAPPKPKKSLSLSVLPKNFVGQEQHVTVAAAEMVGNYALKLTFTDGHAAGIYSFAYLRELADADT